MFKTFFKQFRFVRKDQLVVDASEYIALKIKKEQSLLSKAQLT